MLAADSRPLRSPLEALWALATVSCNDAEAAAGQWPVAKGSYDGYLQNHQDVWVSATITFGEFWDRVSRNQDTPTVSKFESDCRRRLARRFHRPMAVHSEAFTSQGHSWPFNRN